VNLNNTNNLRLNLRVGVFIYHTTIIAKSVKKSKNKNSNEINNLRDLVKPSTI